MPFNLLLAAAIFIGVANSMLLAQEAGHQLRQPDAIRLATFNVSLNRPEAGELIAELRQDEHPQIQKLIQIIQEVRPDVLLLNEFDFDEGEEALRLFVARLALPSGDRKGLDYRYYFLAPSNTGIDTGLDLDGDKKLGTPNDAYGFGAFPGQYGMAVLSRFPIERKQVRTFQKFLWQDMPGALWPTVPETGESYYSAEVKEAFRLSSKSHWDVPIQISEQHVIHLLAAHPTPPVFDGPEDRNGCRNHDEIRLWADYVSGNGGYLVDDQGRRGGLPTDRRFVIAGDYNADANDGDSREKAIQQLLNLEQIQDPQPTSLGGAEQSQLQGQANLKHRGDPALDTADFNDVNPGNLRVDYVLPSKNQRVVGAGVFWPKSDDPLFELVDVSDHRLVWVDVEVKETPSPTRKPADHQR